MIAKRVAGKRVLATATLFVMIAIVTLLAPHPMPSLAAESPDTGEIVILPSEANAGVEYSIYRIFDASSSEDGRLSDIRWANDEVAKTVRDAIATEDASYDGTTAQSSAEFIVDAFGQTELGTTVADSGSFAWRLADAICKANPTHTNLVPSQTGSLPVGYYLVMTDPDEFDGTYDETGTSPIFATVIGGKRTQTGEKTGFPTLMKQVMERDSRTWGKRTVAGTNEDTEFLLTVTLPSNYSTFPEYCLEISDEMEHMDVKSTSDFSVLVDDTEISQFAVSHDEQGKFVLRIDDLKSAVPTATSDSVITIRYLAHLVAGANMGTEGNDNVATLRYTRSPNSKDLGMAEPSSATVYSWGIRIQKSETGSRDTRLAGAEFSIGFIPTAEAGAEAPSEGDYAGYVTADGSLSQKPSTFVTDADGTILVPNVPSGTYIITETKAPDGFTQLESPIAVALSNKSDAKDVAGPYDLESTLIGTDKHAQLDAEQSANTGVVILHVENDAVPAAIPPVATPTTPASVPSAVGGMMSQLIQTGQGRATLVGVIALVAISALVASRWLRSKSEQDE